MTSSSNPLDRDDIRELRLQKYPDGMCSCRIQLEDSPVDCLLYVRPGETWPEVIERTLASADDTRAEYTAHAAREARARMPSPLGTPTKL